MKRLYIILSLIIATFSACNGQTKSNTSFLGKWIVEKSQRYQEQNGKIVNKEDIEKVSVDEAYVYDFKSEKLLVVTNVAKEFAWNFKITKKDSVLVLENINGDAEDDELIYKIENNKLILLRKMDDTEVENDTDRWYVCDYMILKKLQ